jgi:F-type H+-transporting ATPase subunit c
MMKKTVKIMNTNLALKMSIVAGVGIGVVFGALILGIVRKFSDQFLVHTILGFAFAEAIELVIAGLNIGLGVMVGMLTLLLKFYIFSIGIFIPCYLIYSILLKFINIFHKYPKLFKIVLSIFIILLLLFC